MDSTKTGCLPGLKKASLRLVIAFITGNCEIRLLTRIWNRCQPDYCRVCCDEEELETVEHLLCNCQVLSKLRFRTLGRDFFKNLNSVPRADIKALHRFISSLS